MLFIGGLEVGTCGEVILRCCCIDRSNSQSSRMSYHLPDEREYDEVKHGFILGRA